MKRIIFFFIILSVVFVRIEAEPRHSWESDFYSYLDTINLQNNYRLNYNVLSNWNLIHSGSISQHKNTNFNRKGYTTDLAWLLSNHLSPLNYTFHLDYLRSSDKIAEEWNEYSFAKTIRTGGVNFIYKPWQGVVLDSDLSYLRQDEIDSSINKTTISGDGYSYFTNFNLNKAISGSKILLNSRFEEQNTDLDYFRNYGGNILLLLDKPIVNGTQTLKQGVLADLSFQRNSRKVFLLKDIKDTHTSSNFTSSLTLYREISPGLQFRLDNKLNFRDNRLLESTNRNYIQSDNIFSFGSDYEIWRLLFSGNAEYRNFSRKFKSYDNNRYQEQQKVAWSIRYSQTESDSLVVSQKFGINQTDYSIGANVLDNDVLTEENQISLYTLFFDKIKLINHFNYARREEVFLKSQMSGNNRVNKSYNLLPTLEIQLNKNFDFRQEYHLRADYDYYQWYSDNNSLYRKFSLSYSLNTFFSDSYDDFIYLHPKQFHAYPDNDPETSDEVLLNYSENFTAISLRYDYDTNDSGKMIDDYYEKSAQNQYHTIRIEFMRGVSRFQFRIVPRYIWNADKIEFNHIAEVDYSFPNLNSYASIFINPTGISINKANWRVNLKLGMYF